MGWILTSDIFSVPLSIKQRFGIGLRACQLSQSVISDSVTMESFSPPGTSILGISQARILVWVALSSSRGSSQPRDWTHISWVSCIGRQLFLPLCHLGIPRIGLREIQSVMRHRECCLHPQRSDGARRGEVSSEPGESCLVSYTGTQSLSRLLQNKGLAQSLPLSLPVFLAPSWTSHGRTQMETEDRETSAQRGHRRAAL